MRIDILEYLIMSYQLERKFNIRKVLVQVKYFTTDILHRFATAS